MSFQAKRELLAQIAPRYREAGPHHKTVILNEFVAATGYARKYAIRLLSRPVVPPMVIKRPRQPRYGTTVQAALTVAWMAANAICAKRLVPFLPTLVPHLERHGHLHLTDEVRVALLTLSPATADRLLRAARTDHQLRGKTTTKPGTLLKRQIPIRTFQEWNDVTPGFLEGDLVAHCGWSTEGAFLQTLVLTDIATGWTECQALLHRSQQTVIHAITRARQLLPFPLLGLDTDNGGECINETLLTYCAEEQITFTRGRTANKNDQCYVEQKNGAVVRHIVGYDRFEGEAAYRQLAELYRAMRLYVNFFQPSVKLVSKMRDGARTTRTYDQAQTPYQRLVASTMLSGEQQARLSTIFQTLDPVQLLRQMSVLQDALWRHAIFRAPQVDVVDAPMLTQPVQFALAHGLQQHAHPQDDRHEDLRHAPIGTRKYHRTKKLAPRTYRTRPDPFATVWDEVCDWLQAHPERTAKSLFQELQACYPGHFPDVQLRTLQRRVRAWRAQAILAFDDQWLHEEVLSAQPVPTSLKLVDMREREVD